jgi:drug/metabolite transporter (DMT)-like permease
MQITALAAARLHGSTNAGKGNHKNGQQKNIPRSGMFWAAGAGAAMGICLVLWSVAVLSTRVANASLLANSGAIFVALFTRFVLGRKLGGQFWTGLLIASLGMAIVISLDFLLHPSLSQGDLLALGSALFYAMYYLLVERARYTLDTSTTLGLVNITSASFLLVYCLVRGLPLSGYPAVTWLIFALNALIPQVIGYSATTFALGRLPASFVSTTMLFQPVITALLAVPLMGEPLTLAQAIGTAAVLGGIFLVNQSRWRT